jgi:hypothetical protein
LVNNAKRDEIDEDNELESDEDNELESDEDNELESDEGNELESDEGNELESDDENDDESEKIKKSNELGAGKEGSSIKNPFLTKLKETEPLIFYKPTVINGKKFKGYTSSCPWQERRQPLIATKEEMEDIKKNNPNSVEGTWLEYGTKQDKLYYYYCPAYWNYKTNKPMSIGQVENVENKKHIMNDGDNKVTEDKYIYKVYSNNYRRTPHPGFIDKKLNPNSKYMPCCFAKPPIFIPGKENKQGKIILKVQEKMKEDKITNSSNSEDEKKSYILDNLKWPLDSKRFGHLTLNLLNFINHDSNKCLLSKSKSKSINCLLRQGTYKKKQNNLSFLNAISLIFKTDMDTLINDIINCINLDTITIIQNGSIPTYFYNEDEEIDIEEYKHYKLYKTFIKKNKNGLVRIIKGMNNFIKTLKDYKNTTIDYTYLWDIISNGYIYDSKLNMIIIDDIGDNISVMCPSDYNSFSNYNKKNQSFILYKKEDIYEPIISYNTNTNIDYFFDIKSDYKGLNLFLQKIDYINKCSIKNDNIIKSKPALFLNDAIRYIPTNYDIKYQVLNYNGRVCAIIIVKKKKSYIYTIIP